MPRKTEKQQTTPINSPVKFTEEEILSLNGIQKEMDQIILNMGQIGVQEISLELAKKTAKSHLENLKLKETEIAKSLSGKYGKGTLDIASGEFTPSPDTEDTTNS
tara:strand:- start:1326 stop:1640 length:315 start_codon:yes stop_codon:yes gene_type:complete